MAKLSDIGKYKQPTTYKADLGQNGYPNNVANTQTVRTRGTRTATKGTNSSKKLG